MRRHKMGEKVWYGSDEVWTWRHEVEWYADKYEGLLIMLVAIAAAAGIIAVAMYVDDKTAAATCEQVADLYHEPQFKYSRGMGCVIMHNGRWVSGNSLLNNTVHIEEK